MSSWPLRAEMSFNRRNKNSSQNLKFNCRHFISDDSHMHVVRDEMPNWIGVPFSIHRQPHWNVSFISTIGSVHGITHLIHSMWTPSTHFFCNKLLIFDNKLLSFQFLLNPLRCSLGRKLKFYFFLPVAHNTTADDHDHLRNWFIRSVEHCCNLRTQFMWHWKI